MGRQCSRVENAAGVEEISDIPTGAAAAAEGAWPEPHITDSRRRSRTVRTTTPPSKSVGTWHPKSQMSEVAPSSQTSRADKLRHVFDFSFLFFFSEGTRCMVGRAGRRVEVERAIERVK